MRKITVGQLKDQLEMKTPRPILKCMDCGQEFSAHKGDYFQLPDSHVFICEACDIPMRLVTKQVTYKEVK